MDKQTVLDEAEKALDVIEERIGEVEQIETVVAQNKTASTIIIGLGVVLVAASSAFAGYKFAERKLTARYEELAEKERRDTKEFYDRTYKVDTFATPGDAVRALVPEDEQEIVVNRIGVDPEISEALEQAKAYVPKTGHVAYDKVRSERVVVPDSVQVVEETVEEHVEVVQNVFADGGSWSYEEAVKTRTYHQPYIITEEEYLANEPEHEQSQLSFFEEDGVLADAADKVIDDTDKIVGDDNLVKFGAGAKHKDVLFIRNEEMECDFEIARSYGSYLEEALNMKHSDDDGRTRKFRNRGDDG